MSVLNEIPRVLLDLVLLPYRMREMSNFGRNIEGQILRLEKRMDTANGELGELRTVRAEFANLQWEFAQFRQALDRQAAGAMMLMQRSGAPGAGPVVGLVERDTAPGRTPAN